MTIPPGPIAKPLYDAIGADAYAKVAAWLADVAEDSALEIVDPEPRRVSASVDWLAETVADYHPET